MRATHLHAHEEGMPQKISTRALITNQTYFPRPRLLRHPKAEAYMNGSLTREQPPSRSGSISRPSFAHVRDAPLDPFQRTHRLRFWQRCPSDCLADGRLFVLYEWIALIALREARPSGGLLPDSDAPQVGCVSASTSPSCSRVLPGAMPAHPVRRRYVRSPGEMKALAPLQARHQWERATCEQHWLLDHLDT